MSTTFDIFPTITDIPTFEQLLDMSNQKLKEYLYSMNINEQVKISVQLHKKDESKIYDSILKEKTIWDDDLYAWFYIKGIPGGTDAYFDNNDELQKAIWDKEILTNKKVQFSKSKIEKSLEVGYRWNFRRSAGQPGIIVLSYGLLVASLSKLTDGLVYTDDGAWDYSLFPTTADDFWKWYFKPELCTNQDDKVWAEECITSVYEEIKNRK